MTRSRFLGHPLHQILAVFPLGLLATSFLFDIAWLATRNQQLAIAAFWMIAAGVAWGALAALAGLFDWMGIPRRTSAWRLGALHGGANLLVALLFAASWSLRRQSDTQPEQLAIAMSGCGVLLTVITAWLGSELAERIDEA